MAINSYVKRRGTVEYVELPELTPYEGRKKRVYSRCSSRSLMYWDILRTLFRNRLKI